MPLHKTINKHCYIQTKQQNWKYTVLLSSCCKSLHCVWGKSKTLTP